jgi:hypothetical protein
MSTRCLLCDHRPVTDHWVGRAVTGGWNFCMVQNHIYVQGCPPSANQHWLLSRRRAMTDMVTPWACWRSVLKSKVSVRLADNRLVR